MLVSILKDKKIQKPSISKPVTIRHLLLRIILKIRTIIPNIMSQPRRLGRPSHCARLQDRCPRLIRELLSVDRTPRTAIVVVGKGENRGTGCLAHLHEVLMEGVLLAPVLEAFLALFVSLLAVDEVQTGEGSTGAWFSFCERVNERKVRAGRLYL